MVEKKYWSSLCPTQMASTIKSVSTYHVCSSQLSRAPSIPAAQCTEKAAEHDHIQQDIDTAVNEWFTSTTALANTLADCFSKKPHYFLDIFFHGSACMLNHHKKVNPKNTFVALKAQELRDSEVYVWYLRRPSLISRPEGWSMSLLDIQNEFKDEYNNFGKEECEAMVQESKETQQATKNICQPFPEHIFKKCPTQSKISSFW